MLGHPSLFAETAHIREHVLLFSHFKGLKGVFVTKQGQASVARSTALMSIATLGSRATGLIRTWAMAFALGNTLITSAYQVANNMPNVIYELVVGGVLGAAFLPIYLLQKEKAGEEGANQFSCNILNLTIIVLGLASLAAAVFAPQVIATQTFTVDSTAEVTELSVGFFRIFAVQILFYGIGGIVTGILNANRVYFLPSLAPALNNIIVIVSFFAYVPLSAIDANLALTVLAVGTTLGVLVQFAIQLPALFKQGFRYSPYINLHDPAIKEALKIAIPTFVYIVGTMVSFSCRNAFSLQAGDNGPSTLIYAWTWYQLPHGVVAVSLSRALFTEMSEAVARDDWRALRRHVQQGISGTLLLIIPLAGLMGGLSGSLMQLFQAGAFSADDVSTVASVLTLWVVSMPFYSVLMYLYNVFASMRKFMVFAIASTLMVVVQCALYALLCSPAMLGLAGVPVADLAYYGGCCIIMLVILRQRIGSFGMGTIAWSAVRVVIATAVGVLVAIVLAGLLPLGQGMVPGCIRLVVCGSVGLVVIFGLCTLFRVPEMSVVSSLTGKITRKLRHTPTDSPAQPEALAGCPATAKPAPSAPTSSSAAAPKHEKAAVPQAKKDKTDFAKHAPTVTGSKIPTRGRHARYGTTAPRHQAAPENPLPPDATGAIVARARHIAPEVKAAQLPPNATGAIMARAKHIKK